MGNRPGAAGGRRTGSAPALVAAGHLGAAVTTGKSAIVPLAGIGGPGPGGGPGPFRAAAGREGPRRGAVALRTRHSPWRVDRDVAGFVGEVVALPATLRSGVADCALGVVQLTTETSGDRGTVLVRPEQTALDGTDDVPTEVRTIDYCGHDAVVGLGLDAAKDAVRARCPGHLLPARGARIRVAVRGRLQVESPPDQPTIEQPPGATPRLCASPTGGDGAARAPR
jgi:hypothetical protein